MSSLDWVPELAAALDELVPLDDGSSATWDDVVARVNRRRRLRLWQSRPHRGLRLAIVVALLLLLLAGVATATYLALRSSPAGLIFPRTRKPAFAVFDARERTHDLWRCRRHWFCDEVAGVALSPDGKRLALSFDSLTLWAPNIGGMHLIDLGTGADRQIPPLHLHGHPSAKRLRSLGRRQQRTFGCVFPKYFSWSPDGSRLAYNCEDLRTLIYTIRPDGADRHLVPTHTPNAYAPSWSPDGKQIAFSTCRFPLLGRNSRFGSTACRSSLYVVDLDGRHERQLAAGAFPDWSPSGRTIAYAAPSCGGADPRDWRIRLVTLGGHDATPSGGSCSVIGPPASVAPAWSPDGRRIAVATLNALYVMNADGSGLERVRRGDFLGRGVGGLLRPFWQSQSKGQR